MDIKSRISSAIQPKVSTENTESKPSAENPDIQAGIAKVKDRFEASKHAKLFSDSEIGTAKGSRDMYQVVDSEASYEFLLGQFGKLSKGDNQENIDVLQDQLDELKKSKAEFTEKLVENTGTDSDDDD